MKLYKGMVYEKTIIVTDESVRGFAKISGDNNPIHLDDSIAKKSRFGKRIAHGMLMGAYISGVLGDEFPGNGTIYLSQNMNFKKPIYIGEKVVLKFCLRDIDKNDVLKIETNVINSNNDIAIEGEAEVLYGLSVGVQQ